MWGKGGSQLPFLWFEGKEREWEKKEERREKERVVFLL